MLRDARTEDFDAILALNAQSEHFLSRLPRERLERLHQLAAFHRVLELQDTVVGFLLAFREGSAYESVNYRWFAARYASFVYVDRVVIAAAAQGRGLGRRLYEDAFLRARAAGVEALVCEYDLEPPNPASARFHAAFGFAEVGRQKVDYADKWVSLQAVRLGAGAAPRE